MLTCCATRLLLPHGTEIIVKAWHPVVNIYLCNLDMSYGNYSPSLNSCCSFSLPRFTVQPSNPSIVYHKSHSKSTFKVYFQVDFEINFKQSAERRLIINKKRVEVHFCNFHSLNSILFSMARNICHIFFLSKQI